MPPITTAETMDLILKQIASRSLMRLKANTCMTRLVNRSYENALANAGDMISVALPPNFSVHDLADGNSVIKQNPTIQKTDLVLNNHKYVTFQVTDIMQLLTQPDVKNDALDQALANLAEAIDQSIISAAYAGFTSNAPVGAYNTAGSEAVILAAREKLVNARVPKNATKHIVCSPGFYTDMLNTGKLVEYQTRGTENAGGGSNAFGADVGGGNGSALAYGGVGRIFGFSLWEAQTVPVTNSNQTHNIAFTPDAILFAQRRLPVAMPSLGVMQTFVEEDGLAIRLTMNYNPDFLGTQITIDTLYGVGIGRNEFGLEVRS